jgi:hypothetical protein
VPATMSAIADSGVKNITIILLLVLCGCRKGETKPDIWKVVSLDEQHHFTLIHTNYADREQTRYTLICSYYKWGSHELMKGPTACALNVGRVIVPKVAPDKREESVDVFPTHDYVTITEGEGEDKIMQGFDILSTSVEPLQN